MVSADVPVSQLFRYVAGELAQIDYCDPAETEVLAADSWLVDEGRTLAWALHAQRFTDTVSGAVPEMSLEVPRFLDSVIGRIPRRAAWFPRVELQLTRGAPALHFRLRSAPALSRSVVLATLRADDPRTQPRVKGPDLGRLLAARTSVQPVGADEAVILSPDGYVVEGAYSALMWWRGDTLCVPDVNLARVPSVTARSIIALATARATDVVYEAATPADLDGLEIWAAGALHGPRIARAWVDGPALAEKPGRLAAWRAALDKLKRPLATVSA